MKPPLSLERFTALAAAFGARLELWPATERGAAEALCARSAEARALLAAEIELDAALAAASPPPEPTASLLRRLNEVPLRARQRRVFWPFGRAWVPALGFALATVVGIGWGLEAAPVELGGLDDGTVVVAADSAVAPTATAAAAGDDELTALARGSLTEWEE